MSDPCRRLVGFLAIVTAAIVSVFLPLAAATAASPPVSAARIVEHFNLVRGQQPENIALERDGSADLTFALSRQVARVSKAGQTRLVATLPAPRAGAVCAPGAPGALITGIARASDSLYVNYCTGTAEQQGIWRIERGGAPVRIAALPPTGAPNGLAFDERTNYLYVADSRLGLIWRVSVTGGSPLVWANGPALAPTSSIGANGVKVHGNAVWASNFDKGTLLRIPLHSNGSVGDIQTRASGLSTIDDFGFIGPGDTLLAALITANQVAIVHPNGTHHTVLTAADGLSNPTAVAVRGTRVYVPSAAYYTKKDPNLLRARLSR